MKNIVIVDDSSSQLILLELLLNQRGLQPIKFLDPLKALEYIKTNKTNLLITDFNMPEMDGIELIREVKRFSPNIKTSVVSAFVDEVMTLQNDCDSLNSILLRKPFDSLAFEEFMQSVYKEEKREVFCIRHEDKECVLRDKVASNYCMVCCLDDKEDDKEVIQNAIDSIDDFSPNNYSLLNVSAKLSYMANTLSMKNYSDYSDIFAIIKQLVVILHEKAENISENGDIMMLVSSYLNLIRDWLNSTFILENYFSQLKNIDDSIKADFESIRYALGINTIALENVEDIDDLFF